MKRAPELVRLSREHHAALVEAQRLRTATDPAAARTSFLTYWNAHGRAHFRAEEELLLPAYARHGDPRHPLVVQALVEHVALRRDAAALERDPAPPPEQLRDLGERLAAHVRLEERELFPLVERTLPTGELAELAAALERAA